MYASGNVDTNRWNLIAVVQDRPPPPSCTHLSYSPLVDLPPHLHVLDLQIFPIVDVGLPFSPRSSTLEFPSHSVSSRLNVSYSRARSSMSGTLGPIAPDRTSRSKRIYTCAPAGMCEMTPIRCRDAPMINCSLSSYGLLQKRRWDDLHAAVHTRADYH
jgi:hypothetical protein